MIASIAQSRLHNRTVRLGSSAVKGVSIFPFFDDAGVVDSLMLTRPGSPQIAVLEPPYNGLVARSLGRIEMSEGVADLRDIRSSTVERLANLWHFDPWWVLGRPELRGHTATPALKGTNIPGYRSDLIGVSFDKKLSRVTWLTFKTESGPKMKRFQPELLGETRAERARDDEGEIGRPRGGWTLRPFWQR